MQLSGLSHAVISSKCVSAHAMQELDFEIEAANAKRCKRNLASKHSRVKGRVVVPEIHDHLVSKRVLVMEFMNGVKVTER